jgi:fatty-acid peroxygenase
MEQTPKISIVETLTGFLTHGYSFISEKSQSMDSDVFETHILFQKVIFMRGAEAARIFYDNNRFKRENASPKFVQKTLFGEGGVQGLDGEEHRHRKQMFMSFMSEKGLQKLTDLVEEEFRNQSEKWVTLKRINLFDEVNRLIFRAVCNWSGVPVEEKSVEKKTNQILDMIEGAGTLGLRHWKARRSRNKAESWIRELVMKVRKGKLIPPGHSVLKEISTHRDLNGNLLEAQIAAVEILNIIRPTVAVGRFLTYAALALHRYPDYRKRIRDGDLSVENFVQEVRRFYPFFPFVPAIVKEDFEWRGHKFPKDTKVFLDLYGTNHHESTWENPKEFYPERFEERQVSQFELIPQGGGDYYKHHRCPGEMITIRIMKSGVLFLIQGISYEVIDQDLDYSQTDFPAMPRSGFIIENIKKN